MNRSSLLVAGLAAMALAAGASADILWRSVGLRPTVLMTGGRIAAAVTDAVALQGDRHLVVEFTGPPAADQRAALLAAGIELLAPLGPGAFFASVDPGALDVERFAATPGLVAAGPVEPAFKLHPMLLAGEVPAYAVVGEGAGAGDPMVAAYVMFHRDVPLRDGAALAAGFGAVVRDSLETINGLVIELPLSQVARLAGADQTQWIEPPLPRMGTTNAENRALTQADDVQPPPYDLDGTGVTALIYDGAAALAGHSDFSGRLTVIDGDSTSNHATHVSGTVGGDGSQNANNRGMAPNITLLSAGFEYDGTGIFLYSNPGDVETDYANAIAMGADLSNNSIGSNTETNGFPCSIQGDYGLMSATIDAIVGGSLGGPIIPVWATGNERQGDDCDTEGFGDYYSTAPPAGAKNHITVGALNANDDSMTSFSSWGPTDDGRMKPDVSAPGCQQGGDGGVTSCSSSGGYSVSCGTSMASPTACGLAALILQDYRAQFPGLADPLASTMKVFLAHTAFDRGNPGPDYQFGYGSLRVQDAIDFMRTAQFTELSIGQGALHGFQVDVDPGTPELRFTLAWIDPPGTPNVEPALVNDLDIRAVAPGGGTHWPWTLDPQDPGAPAVRTAANSRDNLEQVFVENPEAGTWTVEVVATNVPDGPQTYSLAGSPALDIAFVAIALDTQLPPLLAPATPLVVQASVTAINDAVVPGSEALFYRFDGGAYASVPLDDLGGGQYEAEIPGAACGDLPEFYLQIEGVGTGVVTSPASGAAGPYTYSIGEIETLVADDFESDTGWTVSTDATDGPWERAVPIPLSTCNRGNPGADADGSGQCYLTDNDAANACNSDVDNGTTTLTSPTMDASGEGVILSYHRWFSNNTGGNPETDEMVVEISDDDGASWTTLEIVGPGGPGISGGWFHLQHDLGAIAGFAPNEQFRVRFIVSDVGLQSVVEAAVDGVGLSRQVCKDKDPPCADIDGDDVVGTSDLLALLAAWGACGSCPEDLDGDGVVGTADLLALLAGWGVCG